MGVVRDLPRTRGNRETEGNESGSERARVGQREKMDRWNYERGKESKRWICPLSRRRHSEDSEVLEVRKIDDSRIMRGSMRLDRLVE